MDKFFVPSSALDEAQRVIVSKFHTSPMLPFLREQSSYAGLYISEHTDWSQWLAVYDHCRQGTWFYMPEVPVEQLEAIEIFESFGDFPT